MSKMGYVVASHRVMLEKRPIGYAYRGAPCESNDSGWRLFSGDESQEYVDDPKNFSLCHAATLLERDPALRSIIDAPPPAAFERDHETGQYREVRTQYNADFAAL